MCLGGGPCSRFSPTALIWRDRDLAKFCESPNFRSLRSGVARGNLKRHPYWDPACQRFCRGCRGFSSSGLSRRPAERRRGGLLHDTQCPLCYGEHTTPPGNKTSVPGISRAPLDEALLHTGSNPCRCDGERCNSRLQPRGSHGRRPHVAQVQRVLSSVRSVGPTWSKSSD